MSEAKYKVGELMSLPIHSHPLPIAEVVTCYRFIKEIGALWREEELTPYVRPLAVGDRVRRNGDPTSGGEVRYVEGNEIWYRSDTTRTLCTGDAGDYYRIPTEAGQ